MTTNRTVLRPRSRVHPPLALLGHLIAGRRIVVFVAALFALTAALMPLAKAPAGATGVVASYGFAPSPIAPSGSLAASATKPVTVTAKDSLGHAVAGATVYLSLSPTTGGGSAMVGTTALTAKPQAFVAPSGQVSITYKTPATLPNGGKDTIKAENAALGATISARDSYCFSRVARYVFTPTPIAPSGSLAASAAAPVTVTAKDSLGTAVPGATIYLALAGGGSATVGATSLSATPGPFVANPSGQVSITYHTPATLPASGADTIKAQDAAISPCATKADSYSYSSPTQYLFAPSPIGSLGTNAKASVTLTAKDAGGFPVPGTKVYLSFTPATGGGSAAVGIKALSTTFSAFVTNTAGQIVVTYHTPGTLPAPGNVDTLGAENARKAPTVTASDTHTY